MEKPFVPDWVFSPDPDVESAVADIWESFPTQMPAGQERYLPLLHALDDPHLHLPPVFHVAGTNGKGSVIAFLEAFFRAGGLSVHRFTSPHLVQFEERITLNDQPIDGTTLLEMIDTVRRKAQEKNIPVSFFEFFTILAFFAFARQPATAILLETGLGGLHDATNVIPTTTAIITAISHDHGHILGDTLTEIARQKAGIMRKNGTCVIAPQPETEPLFALKACATETGAKTFTAQTDWHATPTDTGWTYHDAERQLALPLPALAGAHQIQNAGTACAALSQSAFHFLLNAPLAEKAMAQVRWPGRLQRLKDGALARLLPPGWEMMIDGAHNAGGSAVLAAWLDAQTDNLPCHLITMLKQNKDGADFYAPLLPRVASISTLETDIGAAMMPGKALCDLLRAQGTHTVHLFPDIAQAIQSLTFQNKTPGRILVAGSLYLAGHVLRRNML